MAPYSARPIYVLPRTMVLMVLAVLTVSDRCSQGQMTDTAGPAVAAALGRYWPEATILCALVPDDEDLIAAQLIGWSGQGAALVLTGVEAGLGRAITLRR